MADPCLQCNRETPCQHCIARKIPDRCKTFQPGEDPTDLGSRVTRLERSMHENFDRVLEMLQQQQEQTQRPQSASQPGTSLTHALPSSTPAQQANVDAAGSEAGDEVLEENHSPYRNQFNPPKVMPMKIDSLLDTFSGTQGTGALTDPVRSIEEATDLDALAYEFGASESVTKPLLSIFPSRQLADALIDHFFNDINWLRQVGPVARSSGSLQALIAYLLPSLSHRPAPEPKQVSETLRRLLVLGSDADDLQHQHLCDPCHCHEHSRLLD